MAVFQFHSSGQWHVTD